MNDMVIHHQLEIRATHRYGFRSGEWASLLGVCIVRPDGSDPRPCYFVAFPDGKTDYWALTDPDGSYDMRPALSHSASGSPGSESTRPDEQEAPGSSIGLGAEGEQ